MFGLFKKKELPFTEKIKRIVTSIERFCKVIEVRCKHGDYYTLYQNYQGIQECFYKLTDERVYKHLQISDKMVMISMFNRTLKTLKQHDHICAKELGQFLTVFINRVIPENTDDYNDKILKSILQEIK